MINEISRHGRQINCMEIKKPKDHRVLQSYNSLNMKNSNTTLFEGCYLQRFKP